MGRYMTDLGMTPASRSRVVTETRTVDTLAAIQQAILLSNHRNFL